MQGALRMTEIVIAADILMAGLWAKYRTKMSDRTLIGATIEMKIWSQYGDSTLDDFKPSKMSHGKGSATWQHAIVKRN